jgi:acyl dehydratase
MSDTIALSQSPGLGKLYRQAALTALPVPGITARSKRIPERTVTLGGVKVDPSHLADYTQVCGLRLTDTLPLTYPFVLSMPLVMQLLVQRDFPFTPIGLVHAENLIERSRAIGSLEPLDITVHIENLREHPKGLLADAISEFKVGREPVWRQNNTFLHLQKTGGQRDQRPERTEPEVPPPPLRQLRISQQTITDYAAVSGDRNPIHVSKIGAKAFGFPSTIAHGAYTMAAVLSAVEGRVPDKTAYHVKFGKPVVLPATVDVYADRTDDAWSLSLLHPKKHYPHLTGTLTPLT